MVGFDLPRPRRAAAPFVLLCAAALAIVADPHVPWPVGVATAACFATAGAVRSVRAQRELAAQRRAADRTILARSPVGWRERELTGEGARRALAREFDATLRSLDTRSLPSASPLRRVEARRHADLLELVAERLDGDGPVAARGVLLARQLVRDPASPLYADATLLRPALRRVLAALEP